MIRSAAWLCALGLVLACSHVSEKDLERAGTHLQLAQLKLARGDLHYAVREYRAALAIHERDAEAHFGLGEALRRLGVLDEARHHFERAIEIDPDHHDARLNLSVVHLQAGRWQEAIRETTKLIQNPAFLNPARAYVNRAWAYYKLGSLEAAESDLREAVRTDGASFQAYLNLGIVLEDRGKTGEAMESFQRVVRMLEPYKNPAFACAEAEARVRLARAYVKLSDRQSALKHLEHAQSAQLPCTWSDEAREYLATLQ
jgi:type IV pilus assembly protein PilF